MIKTNSDGDARGNPGPGAIGVVIRKGGRENLPPKLRESYQKLVE